MEGGIEEAQQYSQQPAATPAEQLQQLEQRVAELRAKHAALRHQLAAAAAARLAADPSRGAATGLPLPGDPAALADELSALNAARQYLQYLQEVQALARHAEKLARSAQRAFAESQDGTAGVDPGIYAREVSDAMDAFSHAMGYAIALEQIRDQGLVAVPILEHHGSVAASRLETTGAGMKETLSAAVQQALRRCAWPPPIVGQDGESSGGGDRADAWRGFGAAPELQHLFIVQITLQRALQHAAFASLGPEEDGPVLWPAEELAAGIRAWLAHHFAEGLPTDRADRPEWLFAAALKAARQCAPLAEELQPCIDAHSLQMLYSMQLEAARALGSAAVAPLLREHVLPRLETLGDPAAWLHFVDEASRFEQQLAPLRGVAAAAEGAEEAGPAAAHRASVLEVLFEAEGWARAWTTAERDDSERRVDAAIDAPDAWRAAAADASAAQMAALTLGGQPGVGQDGGVESEFSAAASSHEFFPPACAEAVLTLTTGMAERGACLFGPQHRARFAAEVIKPALKAFRTRLGALLVRAEQFDHLLDDTGLPKVGAAICAAHFLEHSFREPQGALLRAVSGDATTSDVLEKEATALSNLRRQSSYKLAKLAVEKFQAAFGAYLKDLSAFAAERDEAAPVAVSPRLLPAADALQGLLRMLSAHLDAVVFRDVWRAMALAVNYAIFNDVATEAAFSPAGARQLTCDVDALVAVFGACTSRPAAHFKESRDACSLLRLPQEQAAIVAGAVMGGGGSQPQAAAALAGVGVKSLNAEQAASVLSRRLDLAQY